MAGPRPAVGAWSCVCSGGPGTGRGGGTSWITGVTLMSGGEDTLGSSTSGPGIYIYIPTGPYAVSLHDYHLNIVELGGVLCAAERLTGTSRLIN